MSRPTSIGFAFLGCVLTAAGCSGSDPGTAHDASTVIDSGSGSGSNRIDAGGGSADAGVYDFGCGDVVPCTLDQVCCTQPGQPTTFKCVAPTACTTANKITCDGPDECGGATPVCCGEEIPDGTGSFPHCTPQSISTTCSTESACKTKIAGSCSQTSKIQICHMNTDCLDPNNDKCCTFAGGGATLTFCIDATTAALAGATCSPN